MSNYRVRQVLALGDMPRRQLRFLTALATYLSDDSRSARVGFAALTATAGLSDRWMKVTRAELRDGKRIEYQPGRHRGDLTLWTVLCLPEKGAPDSDPLTDKKGAPNGAERGHLNGKKGGTLKSADLREPEHGLNLLAKPSVSPGAALIRSAFPAATDDEIRTITEDMTARGARSPEAVIRHELAEGTLRLPCDKDGEGSHSTACRRGEPDGCVWSWCICRCHDKAPAVTP